MGQDSQGRKVWQVLQDNQVLRVWQELKDLKDPQVLRDNLGTQAILVQMVSKGPLDHLDFKDQLVLMEQQVLEVNLALLVPRAPLVRKVLEDQLGLQVNLEVPGQLDLLGLKDLKVKQAHLDRSDLLANLDHKVIWAYLVTMGTQGLPDLRDLLAQLDNKGQEELQEPQGRQEHLVWQENRVCKAHLVTLGLLVLLDSQGFLEIQVKMAQMDSQVLKEPQVNQGTLVLQDNRDHKATGDLLVPLVFLVLLVNLVLLVQLARPVRMDNLAHLEIVEALD